MDITFNLRGDIIKIPRYEFEVISRESWFINNLVNNTESNNQEDIYNLWEDKNIFMSIIDSIRYRQVLLNKNVTIEQFLALANKWNVPDWLIKLAELKQNTQKTNILELTKIFQCKNCSIGFKINENTNTSCRYHSKIVNYNGNYWECCGQDRDSEGCCKGYHIPCVHDLRSYVDINYKIVNLNKKLEKNNIKIDDDDNIEIVD